MAMRPRYIRSRVGVRQRGGEDARRKIRRKNEEDGTDASGASGGSERGRARERERKKARGKEVRDDDVERGRGREREADLNREWLVGRIAWREGTCGRDEGRRERGDDGGTRRENACQLDNSTSTSRP